MQSVLHLENLHAYQVSINYYADRNDNDLSAGTKLDVTEDDTCTADVSAPKLPPKPQPQVE